MQNVFPINDALESNEDDDKEVEDFEEDEFNKEQSELTTVMQPLSEQLSDNVEDNVEPVSV